MLPFLRAPIGRGYSSGDLIDEQVYSAAGTFTWSKPAPEGRVVIDIWGAGGAGGAGYNGGTRGNGADGGDWKQYECQLSDLGDTEQVRVGAGGAKGAGPNGGKAGGYSAFANAIWAQGGNGGAGENSSGGYPASYTPTESADAFTLLGSESGGRGGSQGLTNPGNTTNSGAGGGGARAQSGGQYQNGGTSTNAGDGGDAPGGAPGAPAGGGAGGLALSSSSNTASAGAAGRVRVRVYAN